MILIKIPYGRGKQVLSINDARLQAVLQPCHDVPVNDRMISENEIVRQALENPIQSPRLCELTKVKHRVLVITSDHTRPVPSHITMPLLLQEIRKGNPDAEIILLIATGMHRPTTAAELRAKLGNTIVDAETIVVHDATNDQDMVTIGTLPSGGELRLNKLVLWADLIVSEGCIEPHFFAGFSGGRKSILPGIASQKTVLYNHNAQFLKNPMASQGHLDGNPIHRDMLYAAKAVELAFILNVLINADKRVIAAFAGDAEKAHVAGCRLSERLTHVSPVVADIVITSNCGYPLDQNVYQSVKGMTSAETCVRQGGAIIMCAALGDGHGGEAFYRWFADRTNAREVANDIQNIPPEQTRMDQWEAQILARVQNKATCFFVTGEENRDLIETMHMHWSPDVNMALKEATALLGNAATITVIPDGVGVITK